MHRESSTGDVVQLNMLHGTHFMASASDYFDVGKIWGPWLWYLVNQLISLVPRILWGSVLILKPEQ